MRFTKIPLIATLMAVALSLLIVLPGLAQTGDRTDGKQSVGNVTVGVFDDIPDAQLGKLALVPGGVTDRQGNDIYIPVTGTPTAISVANANQHTPSDTPAYLENPVVSPQDTRFRNTLYASNAVSAYNTVLINFRHPDFGTDGVTFPTTCGTTANTADAAATYTATVRNTRSTDSITIQLAQSGTTGAYQAFFKIVHPDTPAYDPSTPTDSSDDIAYRQHGGPTWCDNDAVRTYDPTPDQPNSGDEDATVEVQETATGAVDNPVVIPGVSIVGGEEAPEGATGPPAVQEIATIFARHGDRLTITTSGSTGVLDVEVDGDGPEFTAVTPADNAVTRSSRLNFSFEVRDDDSGLRHDGESVISSDGDFEEINPDGDQHLASEPLSEDTSGGAVQPNGSSQDIQVNVVENPRDDSDPNYGEISASGTWRMAGSRAGVAYSFTASGAGRDDAEYLYQLVAKDRAGNTSMTDAETDSPNTAEPFVFRVDDIDPEVTDVRTGIGYDTAKNAEKVDRSYVALTFGGGDSIAHGLGDVDTDNIRVVGHTIVGVIHPSKAPRINRGEEPVDPKPATVMDPGDRPAVVSEPDTTTQPQPSGFSATFIDNTSGTEVLATTVLTRQSGLPASCQPDSTATDGSGGFTTPVNLDQIVIPTPTDSDNCADWKAWMVYEANVGALRTWDSDNEDYTTYVADLKQYNEENPGTDIEKGPISEPRARIYLELSEDLAADAKPDVVVVGGAVFDLAGNTNEADTVRAEDWIAPSLTVTVTGTANDRPVANDEGSFTVDVRSDEDMRRRPDVYFVSLAADEVTNADGDVTGYENYRIMAPDKASSLTQQEDENHWAKKYRAPTISEQPGIFGVIVLGEDDNDNAGATTGWSVSAHRNSDPPVASDGLNLTKMHDAGLLLEIDEVLAAGTGSVTPQSNDEGTETESANPFVKLTFDGEKNEYNVGAFKDSHDTVTVTEITLDDADVMANLNRVNASSFSLITRDLAVGDYDVAYTAEDDAGNEVEGEFSFEVKERQPYEISVQPGWNLVSLPATPLEPGIGDVLANNQYISPVLGYQEGDWITAVNDDGTWRGRLEEITGGYGYWVHARTFSTIETMLSEVDPAATLPTVPVTAGWNLLGVLDIFQNDAGDPPGTAGENGDEADNYLNSIPWKVAYTYDTTASLWVKMTPKNPPQGENDPPEIANGNGYWVWSPTPSTLVP